MDWGTCEDLDTSALGRLGEACAARFLKARGLPILGRNLVLDPGEIDMLTRIDGEQTLIEVRSTRSRPDSTWPPAQPLAAFDHQKARQVRKLARLSRCGRIDVITVRFQESGIDIHWVPRAV